MKERAIRLLRWSEKYTKTDMVYLAHGGFWLGLAQFVSTLSTFLLSVAFANLLSPALYGTYKFILSIYALLIITTLSGMDSAVTQAVSRGYEGTLNLGSKKKMQWGTLGGLIALSIAFYYYLNGNTQLTALFAITALFVPFAESLDIYNSFLFGKKLFSIQSKYNLINILITLVLTTGAIVLTKNIYWIVFAYFFSITVPNIFFIWLTNKYYKTNNSVDQDTIKYGKNLSAVNIISLIFAQLDKVLVFHYVGAVDLAVYSLATAPNDQIKGLLKNLNTLAMPKYSERSGAEVRENIWHRIFTLTIVMLIIVTGYIILAPYFFGIFFPKFLISIKYSQILSISLIPVVISGFINTILEAQKATKEIYQYNFYSNMFGIIILFPLIYYYGIWGAIYSRVITRFFGLALAGGLVKKI